jgi:putative ABC transport system permease protein
MLEGTLYKTFSHIKTLPIMFKYELKIAIRKLLKSKLYSSLNIVGLAVGLAACLIIATIVLNDLSYDRQWKNSKQLYKIIAVKKVNHGIEEKVDVFSGLGPELKRKFPEVEAFCRMEVTEEKIKFDEAKEPVNIHSLLAENTIWDLLDFTIVDGNPRIIKEGIDNVVITQQCKDAYFKNENPLGKIIFKNELGTTSKYLITGIIKDIPENTHLRTQMIVLRDALRGKSSVYNQFVAGESPASMPQYLLLAQQTNTALFEKKLNAWYKGQSTGVSAENRFYLQPMQDVYLRSNYRDPKGIHGSIDTVYIFIVVAVLILFIACINYVNLSTAKAIERMRETAVSRVVGAAAGNIMFRFMLEAFLFFLIAIIIALAVYLLAFDLVQQYLGYSLPITLFNSFNLLCLSISSFALICVGTGWYPSYMLSKIKPLDTLKGSAHKTTSMGVFKKTLIITQFSIALIVLIAAITINLQFRYLKNAEPGYDKNNLMQIDFNDWGLSGTAFKMEVLNIPGVQSASRADWYPSFGPGFTGTEMRDPRNQDEILQISRINCDIDFPRTLKLHLKDGRLFDSNRPADAIADSSRVTKVLVSDTYMEIFKDAALEKRNDDFWHIPIGVIKDFHNESFLTREKPFIITAQTDINFGAMLIRVAPGANINHVQTSLAGLWQRFYPEKDLSFHWVDDLLAAEYRKESKLTNVFYIFTLLAIVLACLGLFGLVALTLEKRTKEIGIRKVLGASVGAISALVSKDFLQLVVMAILLGSPLAWYILNKWLQHYPYRVDIYWWTFILASAILLITTMLTIGFKTIKAALANPVKSMRTE